MRADLFYSCFTGGVLGIALGTSFSVPQAVSMFMAVLGCVLFAVWLYTDKRFHCMCTLFICVCAVGLMRADVVRVGGTANTLSTDTHVERTGVVASAPDIRSPSMQYVIVRDDDTGERVRLREEEGVALLPGDRVRYSGVLRFPEAFTTDEDRVFDYKRFLAARGVSYVMNGEVDVVGYEKSFALLRMLADFKYDVREIIHTYIRQPEAGLSTAMLIGMKRDLDENESRVFRNVGIVHIVVLSGMHVMFVFGIVLALSSCMFGYRARYVVAMTAVLLFAAMVGFTPTVMRASLMACAVALAYVLGRTSHPFRTLAVVSLILLFYSPYMLLYDPGFQLSFLAVYAIITIVPLVQNMLWFLPNTLGFRTILTTTLSIELLLLPLIAYSMGTMPSVGVIANVLVLPIVPLAIFGSAALAFSFVVHPALAEVVAVPVSVLHGYIVATAHFLSDLPYTHYSLPVFSIHVLVLIYACVASAVAVLWYRYGRMPTPNWSVIRGENVHGWHIQSYDEFTQTDSKRTH